MNPKLIKITEDKRGAIFLVENLLKDEKEFTFMEIKKGFARGGCIHDNNEFFVVLKGKVKFILGENEKDLVEGESGLISMGQPHAFIALEDSIVSEWGITTEEKKKDIKDKKLRERVEEINNEN